MSGLLEDGESGFGRLLWKHPSLHLPVLPKLNITQLISSPAFPGPYRSKCKNRRGQINWDEHLPPVSPVFSSSFNQETCLICEELGDNIRMINCTSPTN